MRCTITRIAAGADAGFECGSGSGSATAPRHRRRCVRVVCARSSSLHQRCTPSACSIRMRRLYVFVSRCVRVLDVRRSLLLLRVVSAAGPQWHAGRLADRAVRQTPTDTEKTKQKKGNRQADRRRRGRGREEGKGRRKKVRERKRGRSTSDSVARAHTHPRSRRSRASQPASLCHPP